jgi:exopolysaccharide biosynthesis WecB/TagA/CpsF family protein
LSLFGVGYSPTTYSEATRLIVGAASRHESATVSCHAVHALVTLSQSAEWRAKMNTFDMLTPDGQPVRWALNLLHRARMKDRVYGPELMQHICQRAAENGVAIYLYGGTDAVLAKLKTNLIRQFPQLRIAGGEAPPFRELTPEEDRAVIERINSSGAGVVFIGLGCPKQDRFAYEHRQSLRAVQVCVGAAFDFHAGVKPTAPAWMQRRGLEWVFRLLCEPKRLWRRYLVTNSIFVGKLVAALAIQIWTGRRSESVSIPSRASGSA